MAAQMLFLENGNQRWRESRMSMVRSVCFLLIFLLFVMLCGEVAPSWASAEDRVGPAQQGQVGISASYEIHGDTTTVLVNWQGYSDEDVKVSATENTIDVTLVLERRESEDVEFHNSYFTPKPINPDKIKVEHRKKTLKKVAAM